MHLYVQYYAIIRIECDNLHFQMSSMRFKKKNVFRILTINGDDGVDETGEYEDEMRFMSLYLSLVANSRPQGPPS